MSNDGSAQELQTGERVGAVDRQATARNDDVLAFERHVVGLEHQRVGNSDGFRPSKAGKSAQSQEKRGAILNIHARKG